MDKKDFLKKVSAFAPLLAGASVAVCAGVSLSGYTAPVYAVEQPEPLEEEEPVTKPVKKTTTKKEKTLVKGDGFDKEDGTYTGTGTGFRGTIKVSVQIKDRKITAIDILECSDDGGYVSRAKGVIEDIIAAQSLEVDTVSGATFSSRGILRAVKNALTGETDNGVTGVEEFGEPGGGGFGEKSIENVEEPSAYKDGVYTGSGVGFGGTTTVQVTVKDGKITDIEVLSHGDGGRYMDDAKALIPRIIESQSTNVDTVTGASYSSVGIISAVRDALKDAGATADDEEVVKPAENAFPYTEGIYYGTGEGYLGDLTAAVVIQDKTIKAILITESEDDEAFLGRAKKVASDIVEKQTVEVDTVSGATYSSVGILDAVKDALKKAEDVTNGKTEPDQKPDDSNKGDDKKDDNTTGDDKKDDNTGGDDKKDDNTGGGDKDPDDDLVYTDGTYEVTVSCDPIEDEDGDSDFEPYQLTMKVTISKDQITAITDIVGDGAEDNAPYLKKAINGTSKQKGVVAQILEKGKPEDIDTVSKATGSSRSIIEGCRKALEAAKREATP